MAGEEDEAPRSSIKEAKTSDASEHTPKRVSIGAEIPKDSIVSSRFSKKDSYDNRKKEEKSSSEAAKIKTSVLEQINVGFDDVAEEKKKKVGKKKGKTGDAPEKKHKGKPEKKVRVVVIEEDRRTSILSQTKRSDGSSSKQSKSASNSIESKDVIPEEKPEKVSPKKEAKSPQEAGKGKHKKKKLGSIAEGEEESGKAKGSVASREKSSVNFTTVEETPSEMRKMRRKRDGKKPKKHVSTLFSLGSEKSLISASSAASLSSLAKSQLSLDMKKGKQGDAYSLSDFQNLSTVWSKEKRPSASSSSADISWYKKGKKDRKKVDVGLETGDEGKKDKKKGVKATVVSAIPSDAVVQKKPKQKKVKKEKLTEKEKARREQEKKLLAEQEAIRLEEEERLRLIEEKKRLTAKAKQEIIDQGHRVDQLAESMELINVIKKAGWDAYAIDKERVEWEDYLICDGLPKPTNVPEMNTYLHLWEKVKEWPSPQQANHRTDEIVKLLERLQAAIDDPFDAPQTQQNDWKWIRKMFREYQTDNLDFCTYRILRGIDNNMKRIDLPTAEFRLKGDNMALCIWALIQLPIPAPNPRETIKSKINLSWPEFSMQVVFPLHFKGDTCAVRGMYLKYDYLSDTCAIYETFHASQYLEKTLDVYTAEEWYTKMRYNYENRTVVPKPPLIVELEDGTTVEVQASPEPEVAEGVMPPYVPYQKLTPTASEYALQLEAKRYEDEKTKFKLNIPPGLLNLRKYAILGGVYYLDLFYQPFQPQEMVSYEIFITSLQIPCYIKHAPFHSEYKEHRSTEEKRSTLEPEELEIEDNAIAKELEKLILIELEPPKFVFWFQPPIVCHWDVKHKAWHTRDITDYQYNEGTPIVKKVARTTSRDMLNYAPPVEEDKRRLSFRTGRFGPFGLAAYRWVNLPFRYWEMRPDDDGTVRLTLDCAILSLDFHVKRHLVCLTRIGNAPSDLMDHHINVYYKLPKLIRIMRECGVDIFPWFDTTFYLEGNIDSPNPISEKLFSLERHLCYNMAHVATIYNLAWSRWNRTMDYLAAVLRCKLVKRTKRTLPWNTCLVTHLRATIVETTEESETFNDTPIEGMRFYADFFILMKNFSNMAIRTQMAEMPQDTVNTLANLLIQTRILSYS